MTASRALAAQRGISEEDCLEIDELHEEIDGYIYLAITEDWEESLVQRVLENYEYRLQCAWKFTPDKKYHTYFKKYQFKKEWCNRSFKCNSTGQIFTVLMDVKECSFYQWGDAYLDTGRLNSYSRFSNCTEINIEDKE